MQKSNDRRWETRQLYINAIQVVFSTSLSYFVLLSVIISAFGATLIHPEKLVEAATCSIPATISTRLEITPNSSDNIIDCSGQDITITSTGKLTLKNFVTSDTSISNDGGVVLKVRNLTVDAGGEISATGQGYSAGASESANAKISVGNAGGSGGGNGGAGGAGNTAGGDGNTVGDTGSVIGLKDEPTTLGGAGGTSGGGGLGGSGGGAIKLLATATVTINGTVAADGLDGAKSSDNQTAGGGGAGGSIWIEANTLAGNGSVSARGAGTDVTASILGGGGGGGRIVMVCTTETTYAGTVSVAFGQGSQNGQVGTLVGPGCRPSKPQLLSFFETVSPAHVGRELVVNDITTKTAITFVGGLVGTNLKLEVEVREKAQSFQNIPTGAQVIASSDKACDNWPFDNIIKIDDYCGYVEVSGLAVSKQYKWQARVVDNSGIASQWVQYSKNTVNDEDFTVVGAPVALNIIEGNNQSGIVAQQLAISPRVRLVDASGYGVPFYGGFAWSVAGGGIVANEQTTTDGYGEMYADWTLGNTAGIGNNTLTCAKPSSTFSASFTASAVPGQIDHYDVVAPSTLNVVGQPFSYTVTAKDSYNNTTSFLSNISAVPVQANDITVNALGTLTPNVIQISDLEAGSVTVSNATYSYSENIKVKVFDFNGKVGYSNAILVVDAVGTCPAITIDINQTWNAVDAPGGVFDCRGLGPFTVTTGKTLTLKSYDNGDSDWTNDFGVTILADSFNITAGATISANGQGYDGARGPGAGQSYAYDGYGGAHGGYGDGGISPYGDVFMPSEFGSSGGNTGPFCNAGSGGGAIKLLTVGTFTNNGTVSANAGSDDCQNGAGGSVWVDASTIAGTDGVITANGKISNGHGGAGGRIALYFSTNNGYRLNASGLSAVGYGASGPGTVYYEQKGVDTAGAGTLQVDNEGRNARSAGLVSAAYAFKSIKLTRYGHVEVLGQDSTLTVSSGQALQGDDTKSLLAVSGTFNYTGNDSLILDGVDLGLRGKAVGITDFEVGGTHTGGITLYANTWWYNAGRTHSFGNGTVRSNGILTLSGYDGAGADDYGVSLTLDSLTIEASGVVTTSGLGYAGTTGPGAGGSSSYDGYGASHGGHSENGVLAYDSVYEPSQFGSGGGNAGPFCNGSAGGGAMKLIVTGTLTNNGTISADASGSGCNNGAGGSIWIDANTIGGATGTVTANGGSHATHGGAGGRISLYYVNNTTYRLSVAGVNAVGYGSSGPGTVYIEHKGVDASHGGVLQVDNNSRNAGSAGLVEGTYSFNTVRLTRYGHVEVMGQNSVLTISSGAGMQGDSTKSKLTVSGTFNYTGVDALTIDGVDVGFNGKVTGVTDLVVGGTNAAGATLYAHTWWYNNNTTHSFGDVLIKGNGTLTTISYDDPNNATDYGVTLSLTGLTVNAGGVVSAVGYGYAGTKGPGAGGSSSYNGYGASHGGHAENGVVAYGSVYEPITLGSGGGNAGPFCNGSAGGGAIRLVISGTLTNNGSIVADAASGNCNNGAGGSVWIDTQALAGSTGIVSANGASHATHGGAGGRVAVYYNTNTSYRLNTVGLTAFGYGASGPGTVYFEHKGVDTTHGGILQVDNNSHNASSAGLIEGSYSFKEARLTRYGHVEVMGQNSVLTISSGAGMQGDSTKSKLTVSGTFNYTGVDALTIDGIDVGFNGKVTGVTDMVIGGTNAAGATLYAHTWWYNKDTLYDFGSITVKGNGTITLIGYDDPNSSVDYGATLRLSGLTIESGGVVSATGYGYSGATGPGAGASSAYNGYGASHGGNSESGRLAYDSVYEPSQFGSGGGNAGPFCNGSAGGGAMKLIVTGTLTNNGTIAANASTSGCNNGAGGSIWIDTNALAGAGGVITSNGASHATHGGAGGRIAVYYNENASYRLNTAGLAAVGYGTSGAGTIYLEQKAIDANHNGILIVDNNNRNTGNAGLTEGTYSFKEVRLTRYGHVEVMGQNSVLAISSGAGMQGDSTKSKLTVSGTFNYTGVDALTIDGVDVGFNGKVTGVTDMVIGGTNAAGATLYAHTWWYNKDTTYAFENITVKSNGTLSLVGYDGTGTDDYGVTLALNSLTIESSGSVTSSGLGYSSAAGPGAGASSSYDGYGASHGGYFVTELRAPYGDLYQPVTLGSGGGNAGPFCNGSAGGGAMKLLIAGTLTNNGTVSANASGSGCNNGAGGSIWIDANTIAGAGTATANGGTQNNHGGAGGRIAIYYTNNSGASLDISHLTTWGGNEAGPGTVYVEHRGVNRENGGDLYINNNSRAGRAQDFEAKTYYLNNVYIGNNVLAVVKSDINALQMSGNGVQLDLTGDFTLKPGATIYGNGVGFPSDIGTGYGATGVGYSGGGGGANGGDGGAGQSSGPSGQTAGGHKYGDQLVPVTLGSGGGSSSVGAQGGAGGGAFAVVARGVLNDQGQYVNGNIEVGGTITMNGANGKTGSPGGGGGAGGSILLHGNTCQLTGSLLAKGGEGGNSDADGGSGGGGRISILYNVGPCTVNATTSVAEGVPSDPANYNAQVGQVGTFPDEPSSVPWPSQYREQFELKESVGQSENQPVTVANNAVENVAQSSVLGVSESVIPIGGVINGTTVTLKADAYDAGARPIAPKRLKIQIELKKIAEAFNGTSAVYDSDITTFTGGTPTVLSVTVHNLDMGASYKWRVRTVNVDNNLVSDWREFGDNASNVADFTITTVSALELTVGKTPIDLSETTSVTVVARNGLGQVDTSYRGTVSFRSGSNTAELPANYTFTNNDQGQHTFTGVKFFETGTQTVTVEDVVNPVLVNTASIVVNEPSIPFVSIGADHAQIVAGDPVVLTWSSNLVSNLVIDHGVGSVSAAGTVEVHPTETTTYTISGKNEQNETMTSSVTITVTPARTAARFQLTTTKPTFYITDSTTVNLTVLDDQGDVFTSYRGTVTFSSTSSKSQLPRNYTFVAGDKGQHVFSSIKSFLLGDFALHAQDTQNSSLFADLLLTTIEPPHTPYLTIGASRIVITKGEQTTLTWASRFITSTTINQGIGAVAANGSVIINPKETTTYSISGKNLKGETVTSSVTITVLEPTSPVESHTPVLTLSASKTKISKGETIGLSWVSSNVSNLSIDQKIGAVSTNGSRFVSPKATITYTLTGFDEKGKKMTSSVIITVSSVYVSCPVIETFTVSDLLVRKTNEFEIVWKVTNADTVAIDTFGSGLPLYGKVQLALTKSQDITLLATKGECQRKVTRHIEVVTTYPWEDAGGLLVGVVALETVALQMGLSQGNIWLALIGFVDRNKKRRPWGVVYDSVSKKLLSRAIVRLWDAVSGKLVDTVVTDANGIFKLTPKVGKYVIKVVLSGYRFPSELIAGDTDTGYTNIYKGEVIEVKTDTEQLMVSIPVDPEKHSIQSGLTRRILSWLEELVNLASPIMLVVGLVYSIVVTVMYPLPLNYLVLSLYGVILLAKGLVLLSRPKVFGMVSSVDGKLVSGLEVGLFDKEFGNIVARTFTNKKGAYNFVAKNQDYYIRVLDTRYKLLHRNATKEGLLVKRSSEKSGVRLVAENLMVYESGVAKSQ